MAGLANADNDVPWQITVESEMTAMIIGVFGSVLVVVGAVMTVSSPEILIDMPAILLVTAMALFSTVGVSGKLPKASLIRHFGQASVRAGWIGFMVGLILIGSMADPTSPDFVAYLLRAGAISVMTVFYGYLLGFLAQICAPQL